MGHDDQPARRRTPLHGRGHILAGMTFVALGCSLATVAGYAATHDRLAAASPAPQAALPTGLAGTSWQLQSVIDHHTGGTVAGARLALTFTSTGATVDDGCQRLTGDIRQASESTITIFGPGRVPPCAHRPEPAPRAVVDAMLGEQVSWKLARASTGGRSSATLTLSGAPGNLVYSAAPSQR